MTKGFWELTFSLALVGPGVLGCGNDEASEDGNGTADGDDSGNPSGSAGSPGTAGTNSTASENGGGRAELADNTGGAEAAHSDSLGGASGSPMVSDGARPGAAEGALTAGAAGADPNGSAGSPERIQIIGAPFETHPDIPLETLQEMDCLECHANPEQYPDARQLLMGGVVFTTDGQPARGVVVSAVTETVQMLATTGANGLFQIPDDGSVEIDWENATVTITSGDTAIEKDSKPTGACNSCHVDALRLEVPQY